MTHSGLCGIACSNLRLSACDPVFRISDSDITLVSCASATQEVRNQPIGRVFLLQSNTEEDTDTKGAQIEVLPNDDLRYAVPSFKENRHWPTK